ncbi:hypothetical protein GJ496_004278 [Pomphorhynchus laevis]|nr:hypothetical protein GJ496_004278 [Pomphorhynchus laevis]
MKAIYDLSNMTDIVLQKADKGGKTAIWDKKDYLTEGMATEKLAEEFMNKFEQLKRDIPENANVFTMDIKYLYTSIKLDIGIEAIRKLLIDEKMKDDEIEKT